jgi:hypothetical protein
MRKREGTYGAGSEKEPFCDLVDLEAGMSRHFDFLMFWVEYNLSWEYKVIDIR